MQRSSARSHRSEPTPTWTRKLTGRSPRVFLRRSDLTVVLGGKRIESLQIFRRRRSRGGGDIPQTSPAKWSKDLASTPLAPGEYVVAEYTEGKTNLQFWDLHRPGAGKYPSEPKHAQIKTAVAPFGRCPSRPEQNRNIQPRGAIERGYWPGSNAKRSHTDDSPLLAKERIHRPDRLQGQQSQLLVQPLPEDPES